MHTAVLAIVLAAVTSCACVPLTVSGVYNIVVDGLALTHVLTGGSSPITATPLNGSSSQVWNAVVNPTLGVATLQNVNTLAFASSPGGKFVFPSTTPFSWQISKSGAETLFCNNDSITGASMCISTAGSTVGLSPRGSGAPQNFDLSPVVPPPAAYQIQNVGTNTVFGVGFVPSTAFVSQAPATDRSQIWIAGNVGGSQLSLQNLDAGGFLAVASNGTVGAFSFSNAFPWTVSFVSNLGHVLLSSSGLLSVTGGSLKIGNVLDSTATWNFIPVNATAFLP